MICKTCQNTFEIPAASKRYFVELQIPTPTLCHQCSWKNKMAWENEYKLYKRPCSATQKNLVSIYRPEAPFPVYERDYWLSDAYTLPSLPYDKNRPFFEQYKELSKQAPRPHNNQLNTTNSEYAHLIFNSSNCYLSFQAFECQDLLYCYRSNKLRDSMNCFFCSSSELLYESSNCTRCYNVSFSHNAEGCSDSSFLFDCKNCASCFLCWNLRGKKYCFMNEQLSKEEYEKKRAEWDLQNPLIVEKAKGQFTAESKNFIIRADHNINVENCSGDYTLNSKNCIQCFFTDDSVDSAFVMRGTLMKDVYDSVAGGLMELSYNILQNGWGRRVAFTMHCNYCSDTFLSDSCDHCKDCIGCIGLRKGEYCILNKPYSKEEYLELKQHIFKELADAESFEDFFNGTESPFHYEETIADLYYPQENVTSSRVHSEKNGCSVCGKAFLLTEAEQAFCKKIKMALPTDCFACRISRLAQPYALTQVKTEPCSHCQKQISTSRKTNTGRLLCQECYQTQVA